MENQLCLIMKFQYSNTMPKRTVTFFFSNLRHLVLTKYNHSISIIDAKNHLFICEAYKLQMEGRQINGSVARQQKKNRRKERKGGRKEGRKEKRLREKENKNTQYFENLCKACTNYSFFVIARIVLLNFHSKCAR